MSENDRDRSRELDDFWDIESLLPQKQRQQQRPSAPSAPHTARRHIDAVEIEVDVPRHAPEQAVKDAPLSRVSPSTQVPSKQEEEKQQAASPEVYRPHHPLIREVRIHRWRSSFRFYERFCQTAAHLFDHHGTKCDSVPFFSYMPQYDQMNRSQLAWYLYWRDRVRAGEYLDTDYSYIFLYLFEIINLPDKIPPEQGQLMLCRIWRRYRDDYPLLNRYLADWICDYSLIHHLQPPADELSGVLRSIAEQSSFKEFYACPTGDDATQDARIYLLFCTNYDYHKSKLYLADKERAAALDRHIPRALSTVLGGLQDEKFAFADTRMQTATMSRDTFIGALCSGEMKRRVEVDYCSFQRSHELRFLITDIIKYTENKLRAYFGVKSKLSIYALPDKIKTILDAYFAEVLPTKRRVKEGEADRPAYEAFYDLPMSELSPEHAAEIERSSWDVTQQLVDAFDDDSANAQEAPAVSTESVREPVMSSPNSVVDIDEEPIEDALPHREFVLAALAADAEAQRDLAREKGLLPDAMAEQINEASVDLLGDIILEQNDNGIYVVIEDYIDEVKKNLNL